MRRITVRTRVSGARIAVALFVLTATIVFAVPPSAQAESGVTSFSFVSAPGDFVGNGQTKTYTNANATISVGGTAGYLTFAVQQGLTTSWTVNLAAPPGSQLSPGSYSDAERALSMTPGHPGLDVNSGRGCNNLFGNFVIKTISADTYGTVNRLDASFTQHCESPDAPPLTGVVKYRAPTRAPITLTSSNPSVLQLQPTTFTANVSSATSGSVTFFDGAASIGTAPLDANGLASLTTSSLARGNHLVTASHGGGTSAPIVQTIRSNTYSLRFASAWGDWLGGGATASYAWPDDPVSLSGGLSYTEMTFGGNWRVVFAPPAGQTFHVGSYTDTRSPFGATDGHSGLSVSGNGRSCNPFGSFEIRAIQFNASGAMTALDASFVQHCNFADAPPMVGTVHFGVAGWAVTTTPNVGTLDQSLAGISCAATTSCVAVGNSRVAGGHQTLIETWDNTHWSVVPSPNVSADDFLSGVSCTSASACVAVGTSGLGAGPFQTLIERWDGTTWTVASSPDTTGAGQLFGVSCTNATSCVAVGARDDGLVPQTLVETWDGTSWTVTASPNPIRNQSVLSSVSCASTTSCMAAGAYLDASDRSQTLIEQWDGTAWTITPSPNQGTGLNALGGVSCTTTTSCVAVGSAQGDSGSETLVQTWDGTAWTIAPSPNQGAGSNVLRSVSCVGASACVAVGQDLDPSSAWRTLVETWDGTAWTITPSPNQGSRDNLLFGVACTGATTCFAAGGFTNSSGVSRTLVVSDAGPFVPDAPLHVTAAAGFASGTVAWSVPADNGSPIISYTTSCTSSDGGDPGSATSTTNHVVVGELMDEFTYTCVVTATNGVGESVASEPTPPFVPAIPPSRPRQPYAAPGNGRAVVRWTVPEDPGSSPITGYTVTGYLGYVAVTTQVFASTATNATVTGLTNGRPYRFTIAATNTATGPQSVATNKITVGAPGAPTAASAVAGAGRATVRWTAPTNNNGAAINGYVVWPYHNGVALSPRTFNSTATTQTVTGLTRGTTYAFRIAARNSRGTGRQSVPTNTITPS